VVYFYLHTPKILAENADVLKSPSQVLASDNATPLHLINILPHSLKLCHQDNVHDIPKCLVEVSHNSLEELCGGGQT